MNPQLRFENRTLRTFTPRLPEMPVRLKDDERRMQMLNRLCAAKPHIYKHEGKWYVAYHERYVMFDWLYRARAVVGYRNEFGKWPPMVWVKRRLS